MKERLILAVECNDRCMPQQLQTLLLTLKNWGHDLKILHPIVVISSSRVVFSIKISFQELRLVFVDTPYLFERDIMVAYMYVNTKDKKEKDDLVGYSAKKKRGNCLLDLSLIM